LRDRRQQLADAGEFCLSIAVGKEAVMADALEPLGQNMEENRRMYSLLSVSASASNRRRAIF
jgi:hypothetical protein